MCGPSLSMRERHEAIFEKMNVSRHVLSVQGYSETWRTLKALSIKYWIKRESMFLNLIWERNQRYIMLDWMGKCDEMEFNPNSFDYVIISDEIRVYLYGKG